MITISTGGGGDVDKAAEEALAGISHPSFIIYITKLDALSALACAVRDRFPAVPSMGMQNTLASVDGSLEIPSVVLVSFDSSFQVACGVIEHLSTAPVQSVRALQENAARIGGGPQTACLEFCSGDEERLVSTMNAVLVHADIALVGCTVHSPEAGRRERVASCGAVYEDACAYAIIRNTRGAIRAYKENVYTRFDDKVHFATRVSLEDRALIELDGKPAADVYSSELGIPKDKIVDNILINPLGREIGDQIYISSAFAVGDGGELYNYKRFNLNDSICILKLDDYQGVERQTARTIREETPHRQFVLAINCINRYVLYASRGYLPEHARLISSLGPSIDIVSDGEQFRNQHVNQTMVCLVFEEGGDCDGR